MLDERGRVPMFKPKALAKVQKAQRRAYERQDWRAEDRAFYHSKPWQTVRAEKLAMNPVCEECERQGVTTIGNQVHHLRERKDFPELALELSNLEVLCLSCHNAARARQGG